MNIVNYKLVLQKILDEPENFKQSFWHCDSAHCFGGWAQVLSGQAPNMLRVSVDARKFLHLARAEAAYLFHSSRTVEDFQKFLADVEIGNYGFGGYSKAGWDRDGYDRAGYNKQGYDWDGYDEEGFNADDEDCDGYDRAGYDKRGYNRDGYDRDGYNQNGYDLDGLNRKFEEEIHEHL